MKVNKTKEAFDSFLEKKVVPLDKKVIITIFALVIIVPIVAFYFLFYTEKTKEIKGLESREASLFKEITEAKAIAAKLEEHLAEMEETKRLFAEASVLLPQKKEIPSLLTNISALGTNSGLNMATFSPGGERRKEFYAEIPVSIKVNGPYHNIGTFLFEVSKLDRIVSAINISLGGGNMQRGEMLLGSSINLITYRFLEESEMAPQNPQAGKKKR
ncbi:MAG: type 4a pilus biogenesis protein PilO [Desulfobulbaceae bacterium]|jgi:type IV pilus assembly protein PilO|nr:type 4a pilus biogenesis protein PilO [Desulfobulbaceae bacterium]HKJ13804.1 type 4a pilus biogenesis protein PilO [Desulfobulbales bacterium]MDH3542429.1 type 4a pilus biogenesis protein PilO [Desulfobulbaceae bacterium]MDH3776329.1 type 4a pilus biogenesis protein PilO [Desulfobulbaceae bacterium]MDH3781497.1 type 4a pilus biogenesis protein PilO [Desulfobulbaceae bacterium]